MTDLREALEDASRPTADWMTDPHELLAQGRGRVRRRRTAMAGVVAVVTAGIIGASALLAGGGATDQKRGIEPADDPTTSQRPSSASGGRYDPTLLSKNEAVRRCNDYLNNLNGTNKTWVPGPDTVNTLYVGGELWLVPDGEKAPDYESATGRCYIPESAEVGDAGTPTRAAPLEWTDEAVRQVCGRLSGIDLTDWQLMAQAGMEWGVRAEFESVNGYGLDCRWTSEELPHTPVYDTTAMMDLARHHDEDGNELSEFSEGIERIQTGGACEQLGEKAYCPSTGYLATEKNQPAYLMVTTPDGETHRVEVNQGYYSFALPTAGDVPPHYVPRIKIFAADGTLIHDNVVDGGGKAG